MLIAMILKKMRTILVLLPIVVLVLLNGGSAQGHFFGETRFVDGYEIIFAPSPTIPQVGSNITYIQL